MPGKTDIIASCNIPEGSKEQKCMIVPRTDCQSAALSLHVSPAYTACQAEHRTVVVHLMSKSSIDSQLHAGQKVG